MKMKRRNWWLAALFVFILIFAVACGSGNDTTDTGATPPPSAAPAPAPSEPSEPAIDPADREPVTLRFAHWAGLGAPQEYEQVNRLFEAEYPWITVEFVGSGAGGAMIATLDEALAANNPIDLFVNNSMFDSINGGYVADITSFIENDPEFMAYEFLPGVMETFQVDGRYYGVPRGIITFLVYYNKELLNEYGLEVPSYDWTWEDMREMAMVATNPSEGHFGFAGHGIMNNFGSMTVPRSNGSSPHLFIVNEDRTGTVGSNPDVLEDLQWWRDLRDRDGVMPTPDQREELGIQGDIWEAGNALFMIHSAPLMGVWEPILTFDWDVLPFPGGTQDQVGILWNHPLFMTTASQNKEEAWLFMKFFSTSQAVHEVLVGNGLLLPNTLNVDMVDFLENAPFYKPYNIGSIMRALEIMEIDPTITMPGGQFIVNSNNQWAQGGEPYNDWVSAFDYFPAESERLADVIADFRADAGLD